MEFVIAAPERRQGRAYGGPSDMENSSEARLLSAALRID